MSDKIIMGQIRELIKTCPCISAYAKGIGIDHLAEEPECYSIESAPAEPILKKYINGDTKRQQVFVFASREAYGADIRKNIENIGFFQLFSDWMEQISNKKGFIDLGENKIPVKIEALTTGYVFETGEQKAKYQIDCRLVYLQEGAK